MEHFETSDRAEVENYLRRNDIEFEWLTDRSLRTSATRPGVAVHPLTGEKHWFNQANLWHLSNLEQRHQERMVRLFGPDRLPTQASYGDGSPIDAEGLDRVREVLWVEAVFFPWQHGDVVVLGNSPVANGRIS